MRVCSVSLMRAFDGIRGCLAEELQRAAHLRDFIAAIIVNIDVEIAIGDAAHGVAEQADAAGHAAADIKPCHQSSTHHRRNRQHDQYELRGADLMAGIGGDLARLEALLLRQLVDSALELGCVGLRGIESQLGIALLTELVGARGHDSVIRTDGAKLLVKRQQLGLLCLVADRVQVLDDLSLRRADQVAQRLHAADLAHQRGFNQKTGKKIGLRLGLLKPAQQVEPSLDCGGAFLLGVHHEIEIGIVDRRGKANEQRLVRRPHG